MKFNQHIRMHRGNLLLFMILVTLGVVAQPKADKSAVIFTVANKPVTVGEFEYVYTKNNVNNQSDYSEKSLKDYLNLYQNFRLKVREAEEMKLDTLPSLKTELDGYRKQLAKTYLADKEITDQLVQEAYDRMKMDINVSHIMVGCDENANPADTLVAYKKAMEYYNRLLKGEDLAKLAKEAADKDKGDGSAKDNGGKLGWFSAFMMVYPFESAAYHLKMGEVSKPVRSQYGYHVIKLNDTRQAVGEVHVAHIMLKITDANTAAEKAAAKKTIDSIYAELRKGTIKWNDAVTYLSDDRTSKSRMGELQSFGVGRMMPEFETAAFALAKDSDISAPIMTSYGWHIIKRLDRKPIGTFNELKGDLKKRVEHDSRSSVAKTKLIERIKRENAYKEDTRSHTELVAAIDSSILQGVFRKDSMKYKKDVPLFYLAGTTYSTQEFLTYIERTAKRRSDKGKESLINEYYDTYVNQKCLDYEESMLDKKKPEFANLMKEYRDGILLFELTDRQVWGKAIRDTIGLQAFYEGHKTKYLWGKRVEADIYNCTDAKIAADARKMVDKHEMPSAIQKKLNKEKATSKVSVISGKYEKGQYDVVDKVEWKPSTTATAMLADSSYRFLVIKQVTENDLKTLKEAKGYVVSDYQEYLEKNWLDTLRRKYPISVNEDIYRSLIKK
jgi:peptidyl-prolyl cis-trans isomerase SurA